MNEQLFSVISNAGGVLLGAVIAFGTTWYFSIRAERDRKLADAYELFFEVQNATETISEVRRVLTLNLSMLGQDHRHMKWQVVQLPTGFDWSVRCQLSPSALAVLATAGKFDLVNELKELAKLHDLLLITTSDFAARQEALTEKLRQDGEATVDGKTVSMLVPDTAVRRHQPEIMRVEDLLEQVLSAASRGGEFAQLVAARLGPELREALKDKRFRGRLVYQTNVPPSEAST
jgi:hypothetical protein